jgi:hypothetical protein
MRAFIENSGDLIYLLSLFTNLLQARFGCSAIPEAIIPDCFNIFPPRKIIFPLRKYYFPSRNKVFLNGKIVSPLAQNLFSEENNIFRREKF